MNNLSISNISIRQDEQGRYCLNDIHKAAITNGANERTKEPVKFLQSKQTSELINELADTQILGIAPTNSVKGGITQGTYVVKELVYAYAMWISPKFHLQVIRAYDALHTQATPEHLARLSHEVDCLERERQRLSQALAQVLTIDLGKPSLERVTLKFNCQSSTLGSWLLTLDEGVFSVRAMANNEFVTTGQKLPGYLVDPCFIERRHLPAIIKAIAERLE